MVVAILLLVLGLATSVYGLRLATETRRPLDLLGSLLAAVGLGAAILGVGRLLSDRFFTG